MVKQQDNNENERRNNTPNEELEGMEQKDRGGNHNPEGANQYTSGRVDDRGRKEAQPEEEQKDRGGKQNNGQPHANQHTQGRNDDRGRK